MFTLSGLRAAELTLELVVWPDGLIVGPAPTPAAEVDHACAHLARFVPPEALRDTIEAMARSEPEWAPGIWLPDDPLGSRELYFWHGGRAFRCPMPLQPGFPSWDPAAMATVQARQLVRQRLVDLFETGASDSIRLEPHACQARGVDFSNPTSHVLWRLLHPNDATTIRAGARRHP